MLLGSGSKEAFAFQGIFWQTLKTNKLLLLWKASWREVLAKLDKIEKSYHCNSNLLFARATVWNNYKVIVWAFNDNLLLWHFRFWHTYLKIEQTNKLTISDRIQMLANDTKLFYDYWIITIKRIDISLNSLRLAIHFIIPDVVINKRRGNKITYTKENHSLIS